MLCKAAGQPAPAEGERPEAEAKNSRTVNILHMAAQRTG